MEIKGKANVDYLLIFLILIPLYNVSNIWLRYFGMLSIGVLFAIVIFHVIKPAIIDRRFKTTELILKPIIYSSLIMCSYLVTFLLDIKLSNVKPLVQTLLLIIYMFSLASMDFTKISFKKTSFVFMLILFMCYAPMMFGYGQIPIGYRSIFTTTTFLGIFSLLLFELSFIAYKASKDKIFMIYMVLFIILITKAQTRAALLGLIISIVVYIILSAKKLRMITWKITKYGLIALLIGLVVIYPKIDEFSWYPQVSMMVYKTTGKILMSGRDSIWENALGLIKDKPLLGYGFNVNTEFHITPHNSYIGIGLQSGVIGIVAIAAFINSIFNLMYKHRKDTLVKTCTSFLVGNLVVCAFEVMLFQGQLALSLIMWSITAIGFSQVLRIKKGINNGV